MRYFYTIILSALLFPMTALADFYDVPASHPNAVAINFIAEADIVHGHQDGSFQPNAGLNRADFIKIMVNAAFDQATIDDCDTSQLTYPDVMSGDWYAPFVCVGTKEGIINGYADGTYGGSNHVNYAEASKIILETFNLSTVSAAGAWYEKYTQAMVGYNAVPRMGISAADNLTRGEMAQIIFNLNSNTSLNIGSEETAEMNIVETAVATESLSTLVAAVTAGELVETLSAEGPFTVFAPTNDAFAAIQDTVDTLLMPENKSDLQNVLTYHVVAGSYTAADLSDGMEIETVQGQKLTVSIVDETVTINGAQVVLADVGTSNGVVHVIDTVLVP